MPDIALPTNANIPQNSVQAQPWSMEDRLIWADLEAAGIEPDLYPSPNWNERVGCQIADMVVMHYTDMEFLPSMERLLSPEVKVSTHFIIRRDGTLGALVPVQKRAWHSGQSDFGGRPDVNSFSVGIDLVFVPQVDRKYTERQYLTLRVLLRALQQRLGFAKDHVVGHEDIAMPRGRKQDPGPAFDWVRVKRWL